MFKNCQVCGNPMFSVNDCGTDDDGRFNRDYCSNCYKSGHFYARDPVGDADATYPAPFAGLAAGRGGVGGITAANGPGFTVNGTGTY